MPRTADRGQPLAKRARREGKEQLRGRISELETAWEELLENENDSLLNRLVKENLGLEQVLQQYQTKMESIILCSKECLENMRNVRMDNKIRISQSSSSVEKNEGRCRNPRANADEATPPLGNSLDVWSITFTSSIAYQAACIAGKGLFNEDESLCPNQLCESIMAWKLRSGQPWDFSLLLSYFRWNELASILRKDSTVSLISDPEFYSTLADSILHGTELKQPQDTDAHLAGHRLGITGIRHQRRSIALCAYELVNLYRPHFASQSVYITHFWLLLAFLTFLTFPTEQNLNKIPQWLWPTEPQSSHDHPGSIDFLLWPIIRSNLARNWRQYNLADVVMDLAQNVQFDCGPADFNTASLIFSPDGTQLEIDDLYREAIFNLDNYSIKSPFTEKYPELLQVS